MILLSYILIYTICFVNHFSNTIEASGSYFSSKLVTLCIKEWISTIEAYLKKRRYKNNLFPLLKLEPVTIKLLHNSHKVCIYLLFYLTVSSTMLSDFNQNLDNVFVYNSCWIYIVFKILTNFTRLTSLNRQVRTSQYCWLIYSLIVLFMYRVEAGCCPRVCLLLYWAVLYDLWILFKKNIFKYNSSNDI